ncbi:PDZ domain-containing protein [Heyndrickxia acidicola]|uniref:PDZ domain-containing protein n=1 Tax=Heyndrickxia acidicola TaxID=209389 RepID=A0ABU6MMY9_9BACI|nr:PDZ domain-containing protein [Heyndrickxia acidicola]MED1204420.1 PDZ domain-containing protein [Heyndrickxia acidicola]
MIGEWLIECLKGIGRFFLNPLFYLSIILAVVSGVRRMKRERKDFHVSIYPIFHELRYLFPAGLLGGLTLSVIAMAAGFTISFAMIAAATCTTIILAIAGNHRLLSPAFTLGAAFAALYAVKTLGLHLPLFGSAVSQTPQNSLAGFVILMGLLLSAEGIFMSRNSSKSGSPRLRKSRRGLTVGAFQSKRLWLVPVFCLMPAGPLVSHFHWWPVIDWGGHSYSVVLLPFLIGFQQQIQSSLPEEAVTRLGRQIARLGVLVSVVAIAGIWIPYLPVAAAAIAIAGRAWISYRHRVRENANPYYFTPQKEGLMILAVIPGTPAEKMDIKTGELIFKCNGTRIQHKADIYKALQKNGAYCKLDIIDTKGEIRFVQGALYEGDHHELGIITIDEKKKWDGNEAS